MNRLAYVFYATDDTYATSALVFIHLLRQLGVRRDADLVLLHLPISAYLIDILRQAGVVTRLVPEPRPAHGWYYRHCLVKLMIFGMDEYDRVLFVDADSMPVKNLDALFAFPVSQPIAAPLAVGMDVRWGSYLLAVKPSKALWRRVEAHIPSAAAKQIYDMNIVNAEFDGEIEPLPDGTVWLDSVWQDRVHVSLTDLEGVYARVSVVHFSALGKPWSYTPSDVRRLRPHAHPIFYELWDAWWKARSEVFSQSPPAARRRMSMLSFFNRRRLLNRVIGRLAALTARPHT